MFAAGDTILFYSHQDTNTFFSSLNKEQEKFNKSLTTNKLSLNIKKTKYNLLDKSSSKDDVSLRLGDLKFANWNKEEHVKWMDHIRTVESKIAKNFGQENIVQKKSLTGASLKLFMFHVLTYIWIMQNCMGQYA